ncbi:MAG: hypothetical protein ACRC0J_01630 [Shewanella oncorhynchi]
MILGIDPGASTGVAEYVEGALSSIYTTDTLKLLSMLGSLAVKPRIVVIEDSTMQSHVFTGSDKNRATALKVARNIGEVDGYCKIIKQLCGELGIPYVGISPKNKGEKLNAISFNSLTGWDRKSNQHERDAAMVAWRFRSSR